MTTDIHLNKLNYLLENLALIYYIHRIFSEFRALIGNLSFYFQCIFVSLHLSWNKNIYCSIICAIYLLLLHSSSCKIHIWHVAASEHTTNHYYLVNEIRKRATPCVIILSIHTSLHNYLTIEKSIMLWDSI